jgi:hypothetical protein
MNLLVDDLIQSAHQAGAALEEFGACPDQDADVARLQSPAVILSAEEVRALCGGLRRPNDQLKELYRLGFYRARRGRVKREVILERAHVDAVASGQLMTGSGQQNRPKVRTHLKRVT